MKPKKVMIENGILLKRFLEKASINNNIPELLLEATDGHLVARSLDSTETMLSIVSMYLGTDVPDFRIGVPEIARLIKHVDSDLPYRLSITDSLLAISKKGSKGALRFRLLEPDEVQSALSKDINEAHFKLKKRFKVQLTTETILELQDYLAITAAGALVFQIEKGNLYIKTPDVDKIQFKLKVCAVKNTKLPKDFVASIYARPMDNILKVTKGIGLVLYLSKTDPLIIEQEGNLFGINVIDM